MLTLTHIYTPFTILPIYAALEHIPRNLVEASHDLGATPAQTFWKVIFPLSIPGVVAGATFAFVLSLGDFLAPLLVGGPSGIMISNIVRQPVRRGVQLAARRRHLSCACCSSS